MDSRPSRRRFVQGAGLAGLSLLAGCDRLTGQAPPKKMPRIGFLGTSAGPGRNTDAFADGLRELGYVEGQNIAIEYRWSAERNELLPAMVAELIALGVDVIAATGFANLAAKEATRTIPIVMLSHPDPVSAGLIASLGRPGGNITGLSNFSPQLSAKRLELLNQVVPSADRVAVLWNPTSPDADRAYREIQAAAGVLSLRLDSVEVRSPDELGAAVEMATSAGADALVVLDDPLTFNLRARIAERALRSKLPTVSERRPFVIDGGLMSYSPSIADLWRRAATYVDKILKGAAPADLPVEQPTRFELILNIETARALDLTIPPSVLAQATEVL